MARSKRRGADIGQAIREAIDGIFSCGVFWQSQFPLPSGAGTQLSMTGETAAYGNGGDFDASSLARTLSGYPYPSLRNAESERLAEYAVRRRFMLLCGSIDRSVAIAACIRELAGRGITKIIIATDSNKERDNLYEALSLMQTSLGKVNVTRFVSSEYGGGQYSDEVRMIGNGIAFDSARQSVAEGFVCEFLTSATPEVMLISQPSFTRADNILRRGGDFSLAAYLAKAAPVLLTSSETVSSARSMASSVSVFEPLAVLCFVGEIRALRDAVIFRQGGFSVEPTPAPCDNMQQIGF